jgi:hypothetical protein
MPSRGAQLHFHCMFRLERSAEAGWDAVFETIRRWAEARVRPVRLPARDFRTSGVWRAPNGAGCVVVAMSPGGPGKDGLPIAWAMRLTHFDSEVIAREWTVDIGLSRSSTDVYDVSVAVEHAARPGFSIDMPAPQPSAPEVVRLLLGLEGIAARSGSQVLSSRAVPVKVGDGEFLRQSLESRERGCPLIYVSRDQKELATLVSPDALAKLLAGAAVVLFEDERGVDEELQYIVSRGYRCFGGAIRLYQPRLRLDDALDQARHRYLRREEILEKGPGKALEAIVHAVTRRPDPRNPPTVATLEDVERLIRESRIEELRSKASDGHELAALYAADLAQVKTEKAGLAEDLALAEQRLQGEAEEHEETRREVRRLEMELDAARQQARDGETSVLVGFGEGLVLPTSVGAALALAERLFPGRLIVLEQARESARHSSLRATKVPVAWDCLKSMATTLFALHLDERLPFREIIDRFKSTTGFELSAGESERTMADKKLAAKRLISVGGQKLDFSSHVKYGRKAPDCLRVHYVVDVTRRALIVGHCGDHLDTVRTN